MTSPQDTRIITTAADKDVIFNANSQNRLATPITKVYKYRWVILLLSMTTNVLCLFQWIQYSIISNVVQQYYGVDSVSVDWLSLTFLLAYLPVNYPGIWLMDKKGLKVVSVLAAGCNFLAAWIKVISASPDLFYLTFIAQFFAGVAQAFPLNSPSRLAALWFGQNQVSTACSIAVLSIQLGIALGFLLPPIIVKPHDDIDEIGRDLSTMAYILAGVCSVQLVLVILFFRAEPELPPSPGQATRMVETPALVDSLKRLARNRGFVLLTFAYGINTGVFNTFSTLLNQMFLAYFPGQEEDAGRIGLTVMIAGMVGSVVSGVFLDKTHKFKATALTLYALSIVGMLAFTFTIQTNLGVVYGISTLLGFFVSAFLSVGLEFAVEITYPEPEATTVGIVFTSSLLIGLLLTLMASALLNAVGDLWSNGSLVVALLIGTILTVLIREDLRRQAAHEVGVKKEVCP